MTQRQTFFLLAESQNESTLSLVRKLVQLYKAGEFGGTVHEKFPELPSESRQIYLYFTLAPSLNYQRNSDGLWTAAIATWSDPATQFVFFPENVSRGEAAYRSALVKHGLALQPSRHTGIWWRISTTLQRDYDSDPRALLQSVNSDVNGVKALLKRQKAQFPYLSGPKLSNYWLYMLDTFTSVGFVNRQDISIIPDLHVKRATVKLGLLSERQSEDTEVVARCWEELLSGTDLAPCDVHAPLWRWSRSGFRSLQDEVRA